MFGTRNKETPIRNVLERIIRPAQEHISGIRYYYFDDLLGELRSGCSIELDQFKVTTDSLIRTRQRKNMRPQDSFECIDKKQPILFVLNADGDDEGLWEKFDYCNTVVVEEDPCPSLGLPNPRSWVDIPLDIRGRIVGKLSVSLRNMPRRGLTEFDLEPIAMAVESLTQESAKWSSVLECGYSRKFFQPFLEAQLRIEQAKSIGDLASYCVTHLPRYFGGQHASVYLYESDSLGIHRVAKIAGNDPYSADFYVSESMTDTEYKSEADILFGACIEKRKKLVDMTASRSRSSPIDKDFTFEHGGFGALLAIPITRGDLCCGVMLFRAISNDTGCFAERDLLLGERLCSRIIGNRFDDLAKAEFMAALVRPQPLGFSNAGAEDRLSNMGDAGQFSELAGELCSIPDEILGDGVSKSTRFYLLISAENGTGFHASIRQSGRALSLDGNTEVACEALNELNDSEVLFCADVETAISKGAVPDVYRGSSSLIAIPIRVGSRSYGFFVLTSQQNDLSKWRHQEQLRCAATRAAVVLANREILDCTLRGLKTDFHLAGKQLLRAMGNAKNAKREAKRMISGFKSVLGASCHLTSFDDTLDDGMQLTRISELVDHATKTHDGRLSIINDVDPRHLVQGSRVMIEGILYKCLLALYDDSCEPQVKVQSVDSDSHLEISVSIFESNFDCETLREMLSVDLLMELDGSHSFKSRWLTSLRLAQSMANAYYCDQTSRRGLIEVIDEEGLVVLILKIPVRRLQDAPSGIDHLAIVN